MISTKILPRQARDEHRESTQKKDRFAVGGGETDARSFGGYSSGNLAGVTRSQVKQYAPTAEIWLGEGGGTGCSEGPMIFGRSAAGVSDQISSIILASV